MVSDTVIRKALANVLDQIEVPGLGKPHRGKVRDSYVLEGRRILITTDRISAFDRVLGAIPFKGQVLNQLAAFWFEQTRNIAPNHVIDVPDPNVMVVRECAQLPLEFIVRGYITGVTKTSAWTNYNQGVRNLCGNILPEGLRKDQKLPSPIVTPTTKLEEHDRNVSRQEAIDEGLIDGKTFDEAVDICLRLYAFGVRHAAARGLIFVDTKYELGRLDGRLIVTDEINTPDSSRYWYSDTYRELFEAGRQQRQLDKEYVRLWLAEQGFDGTGPAPVIPDDIRVEAAKRYMQAYELITGREFVAYDEPIGERIRKALKV